MTQGVATATTARTGGGGAAAAPRSRELKRILGLEVTLSVVLAERSMKIESILAMTAGTIIEFDVPFDSELILTVANHPIGAGQAVKIGENFGVRLTQVARLPERVSAMAG